MLSHLPIQCILFYTFVEGDLLLGGNVRLRLTLLASNFTTMFNKKRNVWKLIPQNVYGILYLKDGETLCGGDFISFFYILSRKKCIMQFMIFM